MDSACKHKCNENSNVTIILKVLLKQYKSPTGPKKISRGIIPTKADQRGPKVELSLYHVDTNSKIKSSVTKLKLDLYYGMTNSYTKFKVNISKDDIEKSGKLNFNEGQ